jgi:hypothetical protein
MMATARSKGVYRMNPTDMIMKAGSVKARRAVTEDVKSFKKVQPPKARKGNKR